MGRNATDARPARPTQADDFDCASIEKPKDNNLMGLRELPRSWRGARLRDGGAARLRSPSWRSCCRLRCRCGATKRGAKKKPSSSSAASNTRARLPSSEFKNANIPNAVPPSIDFLVQNRFLRKKYKDPMTKDGEFVLIGGGSTQAGMNPAAGASQPGASQPGASQPAASHPARPKQPTRAAAAERAVRRHDRASAARARKPPSARTAAPRDTTSGSSRSTSRRVPAAPCRWPTRPTAAATPTRTPSAPRHQSRRTEPGGAQAGQQPCGGFNNPGGQRHRTARRRPADATGRRARRAVRGGPAGPAGRGRGF